MSKILQAGETGFTYIYTLADPITNKIRYVGKSNNPILRLSEHIKKHKYSITHKNNWIKSLVKINYNPILEIVDIVPLNDWGFWETYWINSFKTWGFNLTNIAEGGIGGNLGSIVNKKISEKLKGRIFNDETIKRMSCAAKNRKLSDAGRLSLSKNRCGSKNPMYGKKRPESSKHYRNVMQYDKNNIFIKLWTGIIIASKELKINRCTITDVCSGRKKTAGGYIWKYIQQ